MERWKTKKYPESLKTFFVATVENAEATPTTNHVPYVDALEQHKRGRHYEPNQP